MFSIDYVLYILNEITLKAFTLGLCIFDKRGNWLNEGLFKLKIYASRALILPGLMNIYVFLSYRDHLPTRFK
jgi:hypothetical protein